MELGVCIAGGNKEVVSIMSISSQALFSLPEGIVAIGTLARYLTIHSSWMDCKHQLHQLRYIKVPQLANLSIQLWSTFLHANDKGHTVSHCLPCEKIIHSFNKVKRFTHIECRSLKFLTHLAMESMVSISTSIGSL